MKVRVKKQAEAGFPFLEGTVLEVDGPVNPCSLGYCDGSVPSSPAYVIDGGVFRADRFEEIAE